MSRGRDQRPAGVDLDAETVLALSAHTNIVAVKDSSGNIAKLASHGIIYPNAFTTAPSDSYPGMLAQVVRHALVVVALLGARWPIVRASGHGRRW